MASDEDLYRVLGVEPGATREAIRAAFRSRVRQHHPDGRQLTPDEDAVAAAATAQLNRAWEVLSDPARRRLYDEQRRVDEILSRPVAPTEEAAPGRVPADALGPAETPGPSPPEGRPAPPERSPLSLETSHRLRSQLPTTVPGLRWERLVLSGYDWALMARSLVSRYGVALRFEPEMDAQAVTRVLAAVAVVQREVRPSPKQWLFLILTDAVQGADQLRARCTEFASSAEGRSATVVLFDTEHPRPLLCTPEPRDAKVRGILEAIGV